MTDILKTKIAILGTTGYIGRALFYELQQDSEVVGYSRDVEAARKALNTYKVAFGDIKNYEELVNHKYDIVINATGIGSPRKLNEDPTAVFKVTEAMDHMVFQYLDKYPQTRVFNLSSGAVYGQSAGDYVNPDTEASFRVNALSVKDGYALAKLHSEAKHRARQDSAIVDLRVFAFVSRFLDPGDYFLVSEMAKCLKDKKTIKTKPDDIIRDFATANDLVAVVKFLMLKDPMNEVFDMKSRAPVAKFELLNKLKEECGLLFEVGEILENSPTGSKNIYAPSLSRLETLGYSPQKTSLENVVSELKAFLVLNEL